MRAGARGWLWLLIALALAACVAAPAARADGDPGSDVLVYQPLFLGSDSGVSTAEQVQLGNLLRAAARGGFPIRVAIISSRPDLGAVTELWRKPRDYARFLGIELSLAYRGRLLVVMPNGFGFNWPHHPSGPAYSILSHHTPRPNTGAQLAAAAQVGVRALAAAAHISLHSAPAPRQGAAASAPQGGVAGTSPPTDRPAGGSTRLLAFLALIALVAAMLAGRYLVRHRRAPVTTRPRQLSGGRISVRLAVGAVVAVAIVVTVVVLIGSTSRPGSQPRAALVDNPLLDPGTALSRPAPPFALTDQFGRPVPLREFRGKVVILAFNDSECTTLCPLTTTAMMDAKAMLGPAARQVQLLGIDANPKATAIEDVLSYSQLHGMLHSWEFLTGSLRQLKRVWKAYSIGAEITRNLVDHTPAIFIIDTHGRLAKLYLTQQSYAAVGQLGQLLATEAAKLLPSHPAVRSHFTYRRIPGLAPTAATSLPTVGGGTLRLGPGRPRLLLFFATWDRQITGLAGGLDRLDRYQRLAIRSGLPGLTAIDEGVVEPPHALTRFLATLHQRLSYPIGIDPDGRLSDGYEVEGQPWLMLVNGDGHIAWYYSVAALGWPSTRRLVHTIKLALARAPAAGSTGSLAGSPPALARLHRQASQILGGYASLATRLRALHGYPIVLNVWASWCTPCRSEFSLFAAASAHFGHRVAFLGADADDSTSDARQFLAQHPVGYPSYSVTTPELSPLASIAGLPTTIYINAAGRVVNVHTGQYDSQGVLDADIGGYLAPPS